MGASGPRIILLGSRLYVEEAESLGIVAEDLLSDTSGFFLVTGDLHTCVVIQTWFKVSGIAS